MSKLLKDILPQCRSSLHPRETLFGFVYKTSFLKGFNDSLSVICRIAEICKNIEYLNKHYQATRSHIYERLRKRKREHILFSSIY